MSHTGLDRRRRGAKSNDERRRLIAAVKAALHRLRRDTTQKNQSFWRCSYSAPQSYSPCGGTVVVAADENLDSEVIVGGAWRPVESNAA